MKARGSLVVSVFKSKCVHYRCGGFLPLDVLTQLLCKRPLFSELKSKHLQIKYL